MNRCLTCWNLQQYCTCPPEVAVPNGCPYHSEHPQRRQWACTCTGSPLFECDCCEQPTVPRKLPGIGYVCPFCLSHWDEAFGSCRSNSARTSSG
jgi:hypothetical protein